MKSTNGTGTEALARQIRRDSIRMIANAGSGHIGGAMGAAEIFAVLYDRVLKLGDTPFSGDRFILSNGHICAGWYAVLARTGLFPVEELATHRKLGSRLQGHPSRAKFPEMVEYSSGPLGQGLSVANGIAMAQRMDGKPHRVFCLVGDGELAEGQLWEAIHTAGHHKLSNVTLIVTYNDVQIDGYVHDVKGLEPLDAKLAAFGWAVATVDGHDVDALTAALSASDTEKPTAVIARTTIAKGVAAMENLPKWHGSGVSAALAATALAEIGVADGYTDFPIPGGTL